jgi:tetratricopeptide (TPR) repeat protein
MRRIALLVLSALLAVGAVRADELAEARKLLDAGEHEAAMRRVEESLAKKPADQDARFLKGMILYEDGCITEAIEVFQRLSQDYPELAGVYNNLAVLYALRGDLERARQSLEMAMRTNPKDATAQENLGDIYVQLAARAYERAAELDPNNRSVPRKLRVARDFVQPPKPRTSVPSTTSKPKGRLCSKPF